MKSTNFPIGISDSGIGGTSIWKELKTLLPNENTIYLSDSKNALMAKRANGNMIIYKKHRVSLNRL